MQTLKMRVSAAGSFGPRDVYFVAKGFADNLWLRSCEQQPADGSRASLRRPKAAARAAVGPQLYRKVLCSTFCRAAASPEAMPPSAAHAFGVPPQQPKVIFACTAKKNRYFFAIDYASNCWRGFDPVSLSR